MEKTHGRHNQRPPQARSNHDRLQPFARPSFADTGLTSHSTPSAHRDEAFGHRKLIRPSLSDIKEPYGSKRAPRRQAPPEQTNAEAFYYLKQMGARTPMVVVLEGGEQLRGVIEWYDRDCLKVNREGAPNLLVLKHAVKYLYKADEESAARSRSDDLDS